MKKKFITIACCSLLCILSLFLTGCTTSENQLYKYGLQICLDMEDMVKNEDIRNFYQDDISDLEPLIANDYDTPIAVYKINTPTTEEYIKTILSDRYEQFEKLPEYWKEHLRYSVNIINIQIDIAMSEADTINFYTIVNYYLTKQLNGNIKEPQAFLYTFETGIPIMITFQQYNNKILARSMFIASDKLDSLSNVREVFAKYSCTVEKFEI